MKQIILDLGGVLIQLDWEGRVGKLLGKNFDRQSLLQFWHDSGAVNQHEKGQINLDQFAQAFKDEFSLDTKLEVIKQEFLAFVQAPYPQVDELLSAIKAQGYGLYLLSNTSAAHFDHLYNKHDFFKHFDALFLSYKMGMMKPDTAIYQEVLNSIKAPASQCYFFDDGLKNIESAQAIGINSYKVNSADEIANILAIW